MQGGQLVVNKIGCVWNQGAVALNEAWSLSGLTTPSGWPSSSILKIAMQ